VQRFPNAKLLDLNDLVCPGGYCSAKDPDGLVVFRDRQHLTDSFVRAQAPKVIDRLKSLGQETTLKQQGERLREEKLTTAASRAVKLHGN
jgi:hypothetical protein